MREEEALPRGPSDLNLSLTFLLSSFLLLSFPSPERRGKWGGEESEEESSVQQKGKEARGSNGRGGETCAELFPPPHHQLRRSCQPRVP